MIKTKKFKITAIILLIILGISSYLYWGNNAIETTHYSYTSEKIPEAFNGFTVVQVSDLHNKEFNGKLTSKIEEENPDIIVVTGDVIDRNRTDLSIAQDFLEEAVSMAPVYFVSGNHEVASNKYPELQEILDDVGVINLDNASHILTENNEQINLIGLADPLTLLYEDVEEEGSQDLVLQNELAQVLSEDSSEFHLLLSHRAELMDVYAESNIDLVLTGHAHGGQIRVPIVGGLFAPTQGFLPEYTSGEYVQNNTTMIVSRGLGNSIFPFRINNRPELVVVTLETEA